ncbi:hypothetical protein NC653_035101 [Populus alba x Populus x berolinensis]|uniref:Mitochondrial pyruvate carrier n=1 Tax=Populus alba x Populus x berolinensis TaxID=444605 RepID=A0AAD6PXW4_9ROSI|nr:hypothetical protein NC653_035101 [Populus alba x Populus x berolinensis]
MILSVFQNFSEFSEIFNVEHFKRVLRADVRIVSSLPSTHLMSRQSIENQIPYDVSPYWIRARFSRLLLILKALDSKLSKNLPPDLQKLRCKVAFHALRFAAPIQDLGNRLSKRMWIEEVFGGKQLFSMAAYFRTFLNSAVGPKTTHFWGPVANWGIVAAGVGGYKKIPEMISGNMTAAMCVCSAFLMRFAWMVRPRNYLLLACHASNETLQLYQLSRWAKGQG